MWPNLFNARSPCGVTCIVDVLDMLVLHPASCEQPAEGRTAGLPDLQANARLFWPPSPPRRDVYGTGDASVLAWGLLRAKLRADFVTVPPVRYPIQALEGDVSA